MVSTRADSTKINSSKTDDYPQKWRELPRKNGEKTPTYLIGGIGNGIGTLRVEELEEGERSGCWAVVYEVISEGESEPVKSILSKDKQLDSYTLDLPGNVYQTREQAVNYAESLLEDASLKEIFQEYGLETAPNRRPKLSD